MLRIPQGLLFIGVQSVTVLTLKPFYLLWEDCLLYATLSGTFTVTGVDSSGPVYLHSGQWNYTTTKAYVAVIVCFGTLAVRSLSIQ